MCNNILLECKIVDIYRLQRCILDPKKNIKIKKYFINELVTKLEMIKIECEAIRIVGKTKTKLVLLKGSSCKSLRLLNFDLV